MRRLLLLTVLFLTGCESTQQLIHLASDYRNEYQPYSGIFSILHPLRYSASSAIHLSLFCFSRQLIRC